MPQLWVRRPSPHLAEGEVTHLDRVPVDPGLAMTQWESYVDVFRGRGWDILEVPPADEHPDGVFLEDAVIVFDDVAVLARSGAPSRRGEVESVRAVVAASGLIAREIEDPGSLDGGDVLKIGRTVYVGRSLRTNAEGIAQLEAVLSPRGWTIVPVPVSLVLHLKSGVTALPDGTVIGFDPLVDDRDRFASFLGVPEEHGTAVVVLDDDTVLMSADAPATSALLRARGLEVVETPIGEFEKLEGCVTCLSVRVR